MAPNASWLTNVYYGENRRAIKAEFSRLDLRRTVRFPFFPVFYVSSSQIQETLLKNIFSSYDKNKFSITFQNKNFIITASTFSELKKLHNVFVSATGIKPLLLSPERQFLVSKKWSYFSYFNSDLKSQKNYLVPDVKLNRSIDSLPVTIAQLISTCAENAGSLLKVIVLSNTLKIKPSELLPRKEQWAEILLENLFWENNFAPPTVSQTKQSSWLQYSFKMS